MGKNALRKIRRGDSPCKIAFNICTKRWVSIRLIVAGLNEGTGSNLLSREGPMNNVILLIARILLAQIFLISSLHKIGAGYAMTSAYMKSMGTPEGLLPLVIALEIGGSIALIAGFQTRWAAMALAGFTLIAAAIFHNNFSDNLQSIMFMKDLAIAGGLLLLQSHGAGAYSVDAKRAAVPSVSGA